MRKLNHTASSPPSLASTKAQGKSSSSWRTALMTRLSMPSPSAWNTLENTMATPAKQKRDGDDAQGGNADGEHRVRCAEQAQQRAGRPPGRSLVPSAMMAVVISSESRVAC